MHPLAFQGNRSGAGCINAGDRVSYDIDGRRGVMDEALSDGEALMTWDDGTFGIVNWNHLTKL